jgi:hypothetical protein
LRETSLEQEESFSSPDSFLHAGCQSTDAKLFYLCRMPDKDSNNEFLFQQLQTLDEKEILAANFREPLSRLINDLINNDFEKLVQFLYRLDIDEKKLRKILEANAGQDAGEMIAELVIERQLQKIKSRNEFKRDENIDENEKW